MECWWHILLKNDFMSYRHSQQPFVTDCKSMIELPEMPFVIILPPAAHSLKIKWKTNIKKEIIDETFFLPFLNTTNRRSEKRHVHRRKWKGEIETSKAAGKGKRCSSTRRCQMSGERSYDQGPNYGIWTKMYIEIVLYSIAKYKQHLGHENVNVHTS